MVPQWDAKIATVIAEYVGGSTELVDTVKFALVAAAATVTLAGTVATAAFPLERVTTAPPAGAGPLRVTVPVDGLPADTLGGLRLREGSVTGGTAPRPGGPGGASDAAAG